MLLDLFPEGTERMANDTPLLERVLRRRGGRYFLSLLVTAVALLVRWLLNPFLGTYAPFVTLFPAIAFSAWYCGIAPSLLTLAFALIGANYWFITAQQPLRSLTAAQLIGNAVFLVVAALVMVMGESNRRRNEAHRQAQDELEERVRQRTLELDDANQSLRELTGRLLQLQDDERRRIARELHDSVGQMLAALAMNLSSVGIDIERLTNASSAVSKSMDMVHEMTKEIRTISYLLHPPLLDEAGLASALRWYIEGFAERSNIQVDLHFPEDFGRLSRELETAIFRTVQECLTNIHRHAESPTAKIRLTRSGSEVRVEIEDEGKGIPPEKHYEVASPGTPGVGIRGMRERLRQLGGSLEIHSNGTGTVVKARLPIGHKSTMSADAA
jgi:signal transduction histidine kinase